MNPELEARIIEEIPGEDSTSREEKLILMESIREAKPKVIVEVGTHRGLTTCYLGVAAKEVGAEIHTYDPFEWGAAGNFRKFDFPITYYQIPGKDCEVGHIDWLFIDGFHEKRYVVEEIQRLFPKLRPGAVVWFHDTNGRNDYCDVPGAIEECNLTVEYVKTLNGLAKYVHKRPDTEHSPTVSRHHAKKPRKSDKPAV